MVSYRRLLLLVSIPLFLMGGCNGVKMPEKNISLATIKGVPDSAWKKLSEKKIFFGHQSVGFNIIEGLEDIMRENHQIRLNIVKIDNPADFNAPLFAHAWIGENTDPQSKIDAFTNFMEKAIGDKADIAFFKFCYVDVTAKTDINKVFDDYKKAVSRLKKRYAETTFIYVTVPLTSKPSGVKGWVKKTKNLVKKIGGRPVFDYYDNIKRSQFNEMLREEYDGKDPVFDLAKIESTFPDGRRASFTKDGKTYYSMVPDYTYDGGHLNELGRKIAAEQLLFLLANLFQ